MNVDTRRMPRLQVSGAVAVTDQMTGRTLGRLGNVSETGLLLLAAEPLTDDALYQLQFAIPDDDGRPQPLDVGVHLLWREPAQAPGHAWVGFRFLTLAPAGRERLRRWIQANLPPA
ncbi:PilZ domain-containing protein [Stenotrophomonas mori]|uniref:PilZ domain-containing protein n=1 Tax=Stenotrophomonas mori TaxID=2871096 RepID=A0ABT0SCQ8_9GAMM|nr:PilZ domain-containing protein [Stenotrophomonas mori]MCL7713096.1 PilZ domain-containing protein [Stenotrophomonas mori]